MHYATLENFYYPKNIIYEYRPHTVLSLIDDNKNFIYKKEYVDQNNNNNEFPNDTKIKKIHNRRKNSHYNDYNKYIEENKYKVDIEYTNKNKEDIHIYNEKENFPYIKNKEELNNINKKNQKCDCRILCFKKNEQNHYNNFFNSKKYIPTLKANKKELKYFFDIIKNMIKKNMNNNDNIYILVMNFLCKNFPSYIGLFAHLWFECKILLAEKLIIVEFFRQIKISSEIIYHFFNCGYDSFETLLSITPHDLINIQNFNNVTWIPGHSFRLKMIFSNIKDYFKIFIQQNDDYIKKIKNYIIQKRKKKTKLINKSKFIHHDNKNNKNHIIKLNLPVHKFLSMKTLHDINITNTKINDPLSSDVKYFKFKPHNMFQQKESIITNYQCFPQPLWKHINSFFNTTC
ncbi:conserved Plasmodium protein, unknown function [Plasmodium sp. DRC-Itaito]|nr:conserved Plasmodium protein, unknown function [Plasmodium sp. DRC-Itaito]